MIIMIFSLAIGISSRSRMKRILISWGRWYEDLVSLGSKGSALLGKCLKIVFFFWGLTFAWFADPLMTIMTPGVSKWLILRVFFWFLDKNAYVFLFWGQLFFSRGHLLELLWPFFSLFFVFMNVLLLLFLSFFKEKREKTTQNSQKPRLGSMGSKGSAHFKDLCGKKKSFISWYISYI